MFPILGFVEKMAIQSDIRILIKTQMDNVLCRKLSCKIIDVIVYKQHRWNDGKSQYYICVSLGKKLLSFYLCMCIENNIIFSEDSCER